MCCWIWTTPPVIDCNSLDTIFPPDSAEDNPSPIKFTAAAIDTYCLEEVAIVDFACFAFTKNGRRIDKSDSCEVSVEGDMITILNSGGVGTFIEWEVLAVDCCGNVSEQTCLTEVVRPRRNNP